MPQLDNGQSGFGWDVQPYRWLYERRYEYTQAVLTTTRYSAERIAKEATQWMQQNAIWKDRPEEERETENRQKLPHARKGLLAFVLRSESHEQEAKYTRDLRNARLEDRQTLRLENLKRAKKNQVPLKSIKQSSRKSEVGRVEREHKANLSPLVEVQFEHYQRIRYGIWLEIAHGGRYSILSKAISYWGHKMMVEMKRIGNLKQFSFNLEGAEGITQGGRYLEHVAELSSMKPGRYDNRVHMDYHGYDEAVGEKMRRKRYRQEKAVEAQTGVPRTRKTRSDKGKSNPNNARTRR